MKVKYNIVFLSSITICAAFILYGAIFTKQFETFTTALTQYIAVQFSWYYLILIVIFLALCLYLLFSKYRDIKLGKADEQPEFFVSILVFNVILCRYGHGFSILDDF
ncbi:glycine betaine transporter [Staphylococcus gallinarum]|uniref:Glycine betaine transporter n=1 Tax=Staphylococcus gallinarum TaxID=1293 RepID=A0A380FBW0_STAGA|nr:glycine betaine transporter [Staphylococcus gallinarum]